MTTLIKDIIDIPEYVLRGDYVLRLAEGVTRADETLRDYVVTPELKACFDKALSFINSALQSHTSKASYLHGSFGSGKSHFMAILHLILQGNPAARSIPELAPVISKHSEWTQGKKFLLVQQAALDLAIEVPYDEAQRLFGTLTGVGMGRERMHTVTNRVAEGLTVLDVAPSREQIEQRIAEVSSGHFRRPVLVLGIDGAYVPTRPESAGERRQGIRRHRPRRARWRGQWREAKGFRFYLLDDDRSAALFVFENEFHAERETHKLSDQVGNLRLAGSWTHRGKHLGKRLTILDGGIHLNRVASDIDFIVLYTRIRPLVEK